MSRKLQQVFFAVVVTFSMSVSGGAVEVDDAVVARAREAFIDRMVSSHDFEREVLTEILADASVNPVVLEAISRPAERVLAWHEYQNLFLSQARIAAAVEFWIAHSEEIRVASVRYGVEPELLLSILGIESFFGDLA